MRRLVVAFILLAASVLSAHAAHARVVVVGLDGASWNVIDPMIAAGELPHIAALVERGVSAELQTVEPVISPVVWTSIATGRSPEAHGVSDFFATSLRIRVPTIYERLAAAGARVGLYEVLMTWPPAPMPGGFVIPGWLRRDDTTHPPSVWEGIELAPFRSNYDQNHVRGAYLEQALRETREKAEVWNALVARHELDVGAVTFYAPDATSHRYWHGLEPERFPDWYEAASEAERSAVRDAMRGIDRSIGVIAGALAPEDTLIVVSDHGFQASDEVGDTWIAQIRAAFAEQGLVAEREAFSIVGTFFAVTLRIHPGPTAERDALIERLMTAMRSWRTKEGERVLEPRLIDVAERPPGMERAWTERLSQWALEKAIGWMFSVEIDPTAQAILFALPARDTLGALWPDGEIEVNGEPVRVSEAFGRERFTGTHHPTAVFMAAGGPIARQPRRGTLSVLDVAPLVAYAAGHPIPDDLEGQLPEAWLRAGHLAAHPPRSIPGAQMPGIPLAASGGDEGNDAGLVEKLRALGYVE